MALTISGVPGLSGFFSKDEILWFAYSSPKGYGKILWLLGTITATLTAFYTFRILFVAFHGKFKGDREVLNQLHESPKVMTYPLIILALLSIVAGYFSVSHFIKPVVGEAVSALPHEEEKIVMAISILAALSGIFFAFYMYVLKPQVTEILYIRFQKVYKILWNKYYFDELYNYLFVKPTLWISRIMVEKFTDRKIIEGIVNGIPRLCYFAGEKLRNLQTGYLQHYAILMIIGVCIILFIILST